MALVLALGTSTVLAIAGTSVAAFSSTNSGSASRSKADNGAFAFAEAGLNDAAAVLSSPANDPTNPNLLPSKTSTYDGGSATWSGTLDVATGIWTLSSSGTTRNPTGVQAPAVTRKVRGTVKIVPPPPQPLASQAWNYIYSRSTGLTCDMTIANSVQVAAPLYVAGNLCLQNSATITKSADVGGYLQMAQAANAVGSSTTPVSELHVVRGCKWYVNPTHVPCLNGAGTAGFDNVWAALIDSRLPAVAAPSPDWSGWYTNSRPGPYHPCGVVVGTPPAFDNDQGTLVDATKRNDSLNTSSAVDLTPVSSYTCKTVGGELSWDAAARLLTVSGTVFIDGSAKIANALVNSYTSEGSLYLSGTLLVKNSKLCAVVASDGTTCTTSGWDPNSRLLVVSANGNGSWGGAAAQVPAGDSIQLVSSYLQGALYGTYAIDLDTTSKVDGPMIGSTVKLGQSVSSSFPPISMVPTGMPGNAIVLPTVGTMQGFAG